MPRYLLLLLTGLALSACTDSLTGPDGDGPPGVDPPGEEPPPETRTVYDVSLEPLVIEVMGSCDPGPGTFAQGEFQYRIELSGWGSNHAEQSDGFDTFGGEKIERYADDEIYPRGAVYRWSGLDAPTGLTVRLLATEWDGPVRDSDMSRRSASSSVSFTLGSRNHSFSVGADPSCRLRLLYRAEWAEREVPV